MTAQRYKPEGRMVADDRGEYKCPQCSSTELEVRKEVFSDSSSRDFRECGNPWHQTAPREDVGK